MTYRFEIVNLVAMRAGLDQHNSRCPEPAEAIVLNPIDHGLLGYDNLWGIPVVPDAGIPTKRFRISCNGSADGIEGGLATHLAGD